MNRTLLTRMADEFRKQAASCICHANRLKYNHTARPVLLRDAAQYQQSAQQVEMILAQITDDGRPVDGWRPIETAPKDGSAIMVCNPAKGGAWIAKHYPVYGSGYRPENPWFSLMLNTDYLPGRFASLTPTHWQPLPTPPTASPEVEDSPAVLACKLRLMKRAVDRWVPCPDHRDKTDDKGCYVCRNEKLQRELDNLRSAGDVDAEQAKAEGDAHSVPADGGYDRHGGPWPFVESPGEFADRMREAFLYFNGDWLAAVRNVLIENQPTITTAPKPAGCEAVGTDVNNYCLILSILGMEEEGDPVAEVQRLTLLDPNTYTTDTASPDGSMVERACRSMYRNWDKPDEYTDKDKHGCREIMRAALLAALAPGGEGK